MRGIAADQLDKGSSQFGQEGRRRSPHSCLQECLNADDNANWGLLLTGDRLRLLHDNPSLVKPAYLAVDLELLVDGELFDEFAVLWLLLHASRFRHPQTGCCVLDAWKEQAQEAGERVLGQLRNGVQQALEALGNGLLQHPDNEVLRSQLASGSLSGQELHRQLLRLVYRFLFLFTAEDRDLLFPRTLGQEDPRRRIYREGYSVGRLRELAIRRSASEGPYGDLWQTQKLVFLQLRQSSSPLGLPGLGGLFAEPQCQALEQCELANRFLLRAIRAIGWFQAGDTLTRVNYRDLNTEELGSVYEGLLELHPQLERAGGSWGWSYGGGAGSDRKTTGSYYTPDQLVQLLIVSALLPVIADRLETASRLSKATTQQEKKQEQEAALLAIRVLDPACGSGHFLLAAARRLALELARIRAGDEEPSEELRQECLREVVAHCIYGVDKNPMAVELCKVALWIEAVDPGKPLSFLDAHIQCGDSLVGVFDPKVLEQGIPDEAYKPLTGDDKPTCTSLKKENASFRKAGQKGTLQGTLNLQATPPISRSQQRLKEIEAMPESTLAEGAAKQAAYEAWEQERSSDPQTLAADLYSAAFFLPKTQASRSKVPTSEHLLLLQSGQEIPGDLELAVEQAAKDFRFFHWHLRFGEVMEKGGFDCVLGNPPWETMSPDIKEWFATYDPAIRNNSPEGQREIMERLLSNAAIREVWDAHCNQLYGSANFIKSSGRYRLFAQGNLGKGDFNTYRFFVELSLLLCSLKGAAGMIVPENLYNGANAMALRKVLTEERGPLLLRGFENAKKYWFPDVHSAAKFCLFASPPRPKGEHSIDAAFCIRTEKQLKELPGKVSLPSWIAQEIGGEALAIPEIRSSLELAIIEKLYAAYPRFKEGYEKLGGPRPYAAEIHMGNDRDLFTEDGNDIPLYEGKMVDQYDYRAKAYVSGRGRSAVWDDLDFSSAEKAIVPQWHVATSSLDARRTERIAQYRIGFCDVTSPTNQRSLVATIIPAGFICGDKVPTIKLGESFGSASLLWLAIANSLSMDFIVRKKVSLKMSYTVLDTLPLPARKPESEPERLITWLAASLALVGPEMDEAASNYAEEDPSWSQERHEDPQIRHQKRAEIEAIYAGEILKLTRSEMEFILDPASASNDFDGYENFGALKRAEIRQFGEYRTQRLVLEAWDRLFGDR
ncbi:MAG: Eco57I restriction-modification methylase domain-containing protein [Cyanobacteriota bacterium]